LLVIGFAMVANPVTAEAGRRDGNANGSTDGGLPGVGVGVVETGDGAAAGAGGGGPRPRRSQLSCDRFAPPSTFDPEQYYILVCTDADGQEVVNEIREFGSPAAGPAVDPEVLAEQASAQLNPNPPSIELSPKTDVNQIVRLPTWMWVTNWEPDSATASVPGVSATVTATPASVTWDMGNGDQVVCAGPGTPFDFSRPEEEQSTDCSYTYRRSSTSQPGRVYQVSATMSYDVSWSASGAPGGGALPAVSSTTTFPVRVLEIHAVEGVGSGGT
jgi:hypothetical protein